MCSQETCTVGCERTLEPQKLARPVTSVKSVRVAATGRRIIERPREFLRAGEMHRARSLRNRILSRRLSRCLVVVAAVAGAGAAVRLQRGEQLTAMWQRETTRESVRECAIGAVNQRAVARWPTGPKVWLLLSFLQNSALTSGVSTQVLATAAESERLCHEGCECIKVMTARGSERADERERRQDGSRRSERERERKRKKATGVGRDELRA